MKKNSNEAMEIVQSFMSCIWRDYEYVDTVTCDKEGRVRMLLQLGCGFNVELRCHKYELHGTELRCWWHDKEKTVPIDNLEQLLTIFFHKLS